MDYDIYIYICRVHYLEFAEGTLRRPFEKLIRNYETMKILSEIPFSTSQLVFQPLIPNSPTKSDCGKISPIPIPSINIGSTSTSNNVSNQFSSAHHDTIQTKTGNNYNYEITTNTTTTNSTLPTNIPLSTIGLHQVPINIPTVLDTGFQNSGNQLHVI